MRPTLVALSCVLALLPAGSHARQEPAQAPPAFRTGIDAVQIDVTVLDRDRRPVRGLTADDFTVLEDGRPRPIVAFTSVDLTPPAVPAPPGALDAVSPDVTTNELPPGRLVVIVMDRTIRPGAAAVLARRVGAAVIDALDPSDLAAVVHTQYGRAQNLTLDRARLKAAVESFRMGTAPGDAVDDHERGDCFCGLCSLETITDVAEAFRDEPQRPRRSCSSASGSRSIRPVPPATPI